MKKRIMNAGKVLLLLAIAVLLAAGSRVEDSYAGAGTVVRVSGVKQLKKAVKNEDVGTIIYRTRAYDTVTIKADKAAAEKFLIIDAPNVSFTNKTVFAGIELKNAKSYTESVSGNRITIIGSGDFAVTISAKKKVENITIQSEYFDFFSYLVRKGAKVKELTLVYSGPEGPSESIYNAGKRQVSLDYTDAYGYERSYVIGLDKSGRITRIVCDTDMVEAACDYTIKYDTGGNMIRMSGRDNENGEFVSTYKYSGIRPVESSSSGFAITTIKYGYDENGKMTSIKTRIEDSMDGVPYTVNRIEEYEYDDMGRISYERNEDEDSGYFTEYVYTYDSKGFLTDKWSNYSGSESETVYKYNKAGDLTKEVTTSEDGTYTQNYKYDKLGNEI